MKNAIIITFLFLGGKVNAQNTLVRIGMSNNIDILNPNISDINDQLQASKVKTNTWSAQLLFTVLSKPKFSWSIGLSYKRINYQIKDRITQFNYSYETGNMGQTTTHYVQHIYTDPADLKSHSNSLGISNELDYQIFRKKILSARIGILSDVYLFEKYNAVYTSTDVMENGNYAVGPRPQISELPRKFSLSSLNASVFFKAMLNGDADKVSLGVKISLGTNFYSNWDQFNKYTWLGLGIELGFGKTKVRTKNS